MAKKRRIRQAIQLNDPVVEELRRIWISQVEKMRNPYPETWTERVRFRSRIENKWLDEEVEEYLDFLDGCQSGNGTAC